MKKTIRKPVYITGKQVASLMRRHKVTIRELSARMGITQKRIRYVRERGLDCPHTTRDWIEAITGQDPGFILRPYSIDSLRK